MWWFMVVVVHKDYDSKESRNFGHRNLLKPLLTYFLTFFWNYNYFDYFKSMEIICHKVTKIDSRGTALRDPSLLGTHRHAPTWCLGG